MRVNFTTQQDSFELFGFMAALILVVFVGLIPTLATGNIKQIPLCITGLVFLFEAMTAHYQQQPTRYFWVFTIAAMLTTLTF